MQVAFNFAESIAYEYVPGRHSVDVELLMAVAAAVPAHRRHCRVQIGSVNTGSVPDPGRTASAIARYPARWFGLMDIPLFRNAVMSNNLCAAIVDGLSPFAAAQMVDGLEARQIPGYLGAFQLLHGNTHHEALYFMRLPPRYHVYRDTLAFLTSPDVEAGFGDYDGVRFRELCSVLPGVGFSEITLRSTAATGSIFDHYETNVEFNARVGQLERLLDSHLEGVVSEITLRARESDPRLLEILEASLETLERDQGTEFLSQTALSCRRFLERLADTVYPPRATEIGEHKLTKQQYVNRLLAYVDERIGLTGSETAKKEIKSRIEWLSNIANKGLHGDVTVDEVQRLVLNLALLTHDLLKLAPPTGRPAQSYGTEQAAEMAAMLADLKSRQKQTEEHES